MYMYTSESTTLILECNLKEIYEKIIDDFNYFLIII